MTLHVIVSSSMTFQPEIENRYVIAGEKTMEIRSKNTRTAKLTEGE